MALQIGTRNLGRSQAPHLVTSGLEAPAEQYIIDPSLAVIGHDVYLPNNDYIVIARGRLLSVKNTSTVANSPYANEGRPMLTLANGADGRTNAGTGFDLKPMGFSETQYFREYDNMIQNDPQLVKGKNVSLPYITASNGAYGLIRPGDYITAYYGSANGNAPIAQEVGKVVKWVPRRVLSQHSATASGTVVLQGAPYPGFVPNLISASNAGAWVSSAGVTTVYDAVTNRWVFGGFGSVITDVQYDYGQDADNIAGQVASFEAVGTAGGALNHQHRFSGWLDWVRDNYSVWAFPPMLTPRPYTVISNETPTAISGIPGLNQYQLSTFPVVPSNQITVSVTGVRVDPNLGTTTTLTNATLPLADATFLQDYTIGQDYEINFITGILTVYGNVSVSSLTVSYSAETSFLDGKIYNPGVVGLTDGRFSGVPGTPANLELAGCVADMHVFIR